MMLLLVTAVYFAKRRRGPNRNQNPYYNPSEGSNPTATTGYSNRPERETTAFIVNSEGKETLDGSVETKVIPHILKNYEKFRKKQGKCFVNSNQKTVTAILGHIEVHVGPSTSYFTHSM